MSHDQTKIVYVEIADRFKESFLTSSLSSYIYENACNAGFTDLAQIMRGSCPDERKIPDPNWSHFIYALYIKDLSTNEEKLIYKGDIDLSKIKMNQISQNIMVPYQWTKNDKKILLNCPFILQTCANDCHDGKYFGCDYNIVDSGSLNMENLPVLEHHSTLPSSYRDDYFLDKYRYTWYTKSDSPMIYICNRGGGPWPTAHENQVEANLFNMETGETISLGRYPGFDIEIRKNDNPNNLTILKWKIGPYINEGDVYVSNEKIDGCYQAESVEEEVINLEKYIELL